MKSGPSEIKLLEFIKSSLQAESINLENSEIVRGSLKDAIKEVNNGILRIKNNKVLMACE